VYGETVGFSKSRSLPDSAVFNESDEAWDSLPLPPSAELDHSFDFANSRVISSAAYERTIGLAKSPAVESSSMRDSAIFNESHVIPKSAAFDHSSDFLKSNVLIPHPTPSLSIPFTEAATQPATRARSPTSRRPSSASTTRTAAFAASAVGGVLLGAIIIIVIVWLSRRQPSASSYSLRDFEGVGTPADNEWTIPMSIIGEITGHEFDNPLADTVIGSEDFFAHE
jgi:hypothetical protein